MQLHRMVCRAKDDPDFVMIVDQFLEQPEVTEDRNVFFEDYNPAGNNRIDGRYFIPGNSQYNHFFGLIIDVNVQIFKNAVEIAGKEISANNYRDAAMTLVDSQPIKDSNNNSEDSNFLYHDDATLSIGNGITSTEWKENGKRKAIIYDHANPENTSLGVGGLDYFYGPISCYEPYAYATFRPEAKTAAGYGYGYRPSGNTTKPKQVPVSN